MPLARVVITWWLTPGDPEPKPLIGTNMSDYGWVRVGQESVMVEMPVVDPDSCVLQSLKQRREAAEKESAKMLAEIDRQIEEALRGKQ